jgi:hypothetical protein
VSLLSEALFRCRAEPRPARDIVSAHASHEPYRAFVLAISFAHPSHHPFRRSQHHDGRFHHLPAVRLAGAAGPRPRRVAPFAAASAKKITSNPRAALSSGSSRRAATAAAGLRVSTCKGFNNVRFVPPRTTPHFTRAHLGNLS